MDKSLRREVVVDELLGENFWDLCGSWRLVSHLLPLKILEELSPAEREVCSKLLNTTLLGNLDLITLDRLLFASINLVKLQLLLVVGAEVADQTVEVVEVTLVLRESEFFLIHLHGGIDGRDLVQEVIDLLLLPLELAILLIQVVDDPD